MRRLAAGGLAIGALAALVFTLLSGAQAQRNERAVMVSVEFGHACCALLVSGTIECWGGNSFGKAVEPVGVFSAVSAGASHTCGLRESGTIECWGGNFYGQTNAPDGVFSAVSAGREHSCGLRVSGTIECWGYNFYGQTDAPSGVFSAVSAGQEHSCGLRMSGAVECWGSNEYGQTDAPRRRVQRGERRRTKSYSCGVREERHVLNAGGTRQTRPSGDLQCGECIGGAHSCGAADPSGGSSVGEVTIHGGQADAP